MRKVILALVAAAFLATAPAPALAGGGEKGDFELGPYAGYGWLDEYGYLQPKNDKLYGVRFGYFFTPGWSAELSLQRLPTETDVNLPGVPEDDVNLDACRLNMLYNFAPGSNFRPFMTLGVGCEKFNAHALGETSGIGLNAGGGLRLLMGKHFAIRLDGRYVSRRVRMFMEPGDVVRGKERENNIEATLGLSFLFGGGGGPPPEIDRDSDGDGVLDKNDDCPDTPRGATVDSRGCPHDSDGDGVWDGIDQCPDTPRGATVDSRGCPHDSDGDGVWDGIDQCPDTPRGATVDSRGCPHDSDGDGVWDGIDQCPDTPRGVTVDSRGCPIPEPRTPPPLIQRLLEKKAVILEGVEFDVDKETLRPASYTTLNEVAASLKDYPEIRVEIQGHTDSSASSAHNQALSNRRAESVRAYLVSKGINASHFNAKGYGEDYPIADNTTKEGKQRNRRVELHRID